jgi:hypothetical protein
MDLQQEREELLQRAACTRPEQCVGSYQTGVSSQNEKANLK